MEKSETWQILYLGIYLCSYDRFCCLYIFYKEFVEYIWWLKVGWLVGCCTAAVSPGFQGAPRGGGSRILPPFAPTVQGMMRDGRRQEMTSAYWWY